MGLIWAYAYVPKKWFERAQNEELGESSEESYGEYAEISSTV
jgi:hypothetical protein